jgi:bacillopeptidase F (M6 metalloprotease family)
MSNWNWTTSEDTTCGVGYDVAEVIVDNGSFYYTYFLCRGNDTHGWVKIVFDFRAYAGKTVNIEIRLETNTINISRLFVDHVAFQSSP